jgi:hypothetical protein
MAKQTTIDVQGIEIRILEKNKTDYICLTDLAKNASDRTDIVISNWFRNRNTIEFLGLWEKMHNPTFNPIEFDGIKSRTGLNNFILTTNEWVSKVNAVGIEARAGRYGGTYAHKDIAFEFCSWMSPVFKLYFITEFQRLKTIEAEQQKDSLDWQLKRTLSKINYKIHADAIKKHLIPLKIKDTKFEGLYYASEADLLNLALFGMTAKQWRDGNPDLKGNMRDYGTAEQLLVLANIENLNAEFIKMGISKADRLTKLNDVAIYQMELLVDSNVNLSKRGGETTPILPS